MKTTILLLFVLVASGAGLRADDALVVIVNKTNPVDALSKTQVQKMVMGEQAQWGNGKKVAVALRSPGQGERDAVLRIVCGMSESEFSQHLLHATFNGGTFAPKALASGAAVRATVAAVPGAIGFVRSADVDDSVKVVRFDGALPADTGYKLKVK